MFFFGGGGGGGYSGGGGGGTGSVCANYFCTPFGGGGGGGGSYWGSNVSNQVGFATTNIGNGWFNIVLQAAIASAASPLAASTLGASGNAALQGGTLTIDAAGSYGGGVSLDGSGANAIDMAGRKAVLAGVIADAAPGTPGSVVFANSAAGGSLTLAGANTFTGTATVEKGATVMLSGAGSLASASAVAVNGTLDVSGAAGPASLAGLSGNGAVALGGTTLVLTNAAGTFAGSIGGAGGLAVAGGTQILSGVNAYAGTTSIAAGATLALVGSGSIAASGDPTVNGTFDISGTASGASVASLSGSGAVLLGARTLTLTAAADTFAGTISGSGGLAVAAGTEALSGASTYSGATTIGAGATLALVGAGSIAASGVVANGTLDVSGTAAGATVRSLTGGGAVVLGGQTLTVTGASGTFGGAIGGTGGLTIAGGAQTLSGTSSYAGLTTVAPGAMLSVNGTLASLVAVGGTLHGTGTVGGAAVLAGGTLAPGNSPGTLTVAGPVAMAAGSVLSLDIDGTGIGTGAGNYARLVLIGAGGAFAAGGTLMPVLRGIAGSATNGFTPAIGQFFQVVTAPAGVAGRFAALAQPSGGLAAGERLEVIYAPLSVTLAPASYADLARGGVAQPQSSVAVGAAVDALIAGPTQSGVAVALAPLTAAQAAAALGVLAGDAAPPVYGAAVMAAREAWYAGAAQVQAQLASRRDGAPAGQSGAGPGGSTVWAGGTGRFLRASASGGGYHASMGGAAAGIDVPVENALGPRFLLGAAVAGGTTTTAAGAGTDTDTTVQLTVYGGWHAGIAFADAQASWLHGDRDTRRDIVFLGGSARGQGALQGGGGQVDAGLRLDLGPVALEPRVGLAAIGLWGGGATESTGGAFAGQIGGTGLSSVQATAALRASGRFEVAAGVPAFVHAQVGWEHEMRDLSASATASSVALGAAVFVASPIAVARDTARLGFGVDVAVGPSAQVYASYDAGLSATTVAQALTGGVRVTR